MTAMPVAAQTILTPTPEDVAAAIDIPAADIVSVELIRPNNQRTAAVANSWGPALVPAAGTNLALFSTGTARLPSHARYVSPVSGSDWARAAHVPLPVPQVMVPDYCPVNESLRDMTEFRVTLNAPAVPRGCNSITTT
jgi:hypothetical protein